jgi:hypothetical protein
MSRHEYTPPGWPSHYRFVIGWDDPLGSYFAVVSDCSAGPGEDGNIVAAAGEPPHFKELDKLMRVVNGRLEGRLPPVQLPGELARAMRKDAKAERPVLNALTMTDPGDRAPGSTPLIRSCTALGTHQDYLEGDELRDVLAGMADTFFRLERLYLPRKEDGLTEHNDADTKLIRTSLEHMDMVCHILASFLRGDALVAAAALKPFYELSAYAAEVLQAHEAVAAVAGETVH